MRPHDGWLVLILSLPHEPSSIRIRAWRRMRGLGEAVLAAGLTLFDGLYEVLNGR